MRPYSPNTGAENPHPGRALFIAASPTTTSLAFSWCRAEHRAMTRGTVTVVETARLDFDKISGSFRFTRVDLVRVSTSLFN
jgi:hypothetical protein